MGLTLTLSGLGRADPPAADEVLRLPPFLVEDQRFSGNDWLYGEEPGLQYLSAASSEETDLFLSDLRRHREALKRFIPDEFLLQTSAPTTLILYPEAQMEAMDREMMRVLQGKEDHAGKQTVEIVHDLRLSEPDSSYLFVVLKPRSGPIFPTPSRFSEAKPRIVLSADYVRFLLGTRAPTLPDWFVAGIAGLYQADRFPELESERGVTLTQREKQRSRVGENFDPTHWISDADAAVLQSDPAAPRPLLPLRELFVPVAPAAAPEAYRRVWAAQAELFVRWCFSGEVADGRERLWRFARETALHPASEDAFRSAFSLDYADARDRLSDYLSEAVSGPILAPVVRIETPPSVRMRSASPGEIRRVMGEWTRRSLRMIRSDFPKALPTYEEKTRRLLTRAYETGDRDPQLVASLALFHFDMGERAEARRILEENPSAASIRPMAALVRAELDYLALLPDEGGAGAKLSDEAAAKILGEIDVALALRPPLEAAYVLVARVLQHLQREPTAIDRALIDRGARLFPRNPELAVYAAAWELRAGETEQARSLTELALSQCTNATSQDKLTVLHRLATHAAAEANGDARAPGASRR